MRRCNIFKVIFRDSERMLSIGRGCAILWNVLNYRRRQSFFAREFDWSFKEEYNAFKGWIGSATAQTIARKNNQAWKSFFALLRKRKEGKLPNNVRRIGPPGYWKNRKTGEVAVRILVRSDCYRIEGRSIRFPRGIRGRIKGKPRWMGKQGQIELLYDRDKKCWYAHQIVQVEPQHQPKGHKKAFVDLGVRYILTFIIEDMKKPIAYSGTPLLADWYYWNTRIDAHQSELKHKNGRHISKRLKKLFRTRKLRLKQAINTYVHRFVQFCYENNVNKIIAGDLKNILNNNKEWNKKANAMVHNFWSHRYLTDRLSWTAQNHGISLILINEAGTSSQCPWCGSRRSVKRGRLFQCRGCGIEAHRDAVGALNIGLIHGTLCEGDINRVMAHPEVKT